MSAESGAVAFGSARWAAGHPGFAALVASVLAHAGVAAIVVAMVLRSGLTPNDMIDVLWNTVLLVTGAALFLVGLPVSLGFAGASCVTQRELWAGVAGGFATVMLTLCVVAFVGPLNGVG